MPRHGLDPITEAELARQVEATIWVCNLYIGLFVVACAVLTARRCALGLERALARRRARRAHRSRREGGSLLGAARSASLDSRRSSYGSCDDSDEQDGKGDKAFEQLPFAKLCEKVDRTLGQPVDLPLIPPSWDWTQLVLITALVAANVAACVVVNLSIRPGAQLSTLQFFAVRTGRVAVANFIPLFLLAGRHNPVAWLTGIPYQTLRMYHKLTGLMSFIQTLLHTFAYIAFFVQRRGWGDWWRPFLKPYIIWGTVGTIASVPCTVLALQAIRNMAYEWFLVTHIVGAIVFLVGTWYHYRREVYIPILISLAFWGFERLWRFVALATAEWRRHRVVLEGEAEVRHGAVLLSVPLPEGSWHAGQHFYIYFWGLPLLRQPWLYGQSHPMTVANSSGTGVTHVEFIIRIHGGITRTIAELVLVRSGLTGVVKLPVSLEGPFGMRPRVEEFERVLLVGGGSGITYPASALSAIVNGKGEGRWRGLREVKLVWAIHHLAQGEWLHDALPAARALADATHLRLSLDLYVTRDNSFSPTTSQADLPSSTILSPASDPTTPMTETSARVQDSLDGDDTAPLLDPLKAEPARPAFVAGEALGRAGVFYGRPDVRRIVEGFVREGTGRTEVLACGPEGMTEEVRRAGARVAGEGCEVVVKVETFAG